MDQYFYPAIFHKEKRGGYWISFPDFPECLTQGKDIDDAYKMASDAIGLCIEDKLKNNEELPHASAPVDYIVEDGDFSCLIEFNLMQYKKAHNTKAVKKTLTIPEWLNEAAIAQNINFSQVLQDALVQKIELLNNDKAVN